MNDRIKEILDYPTDTPLKFWLKYWDHRIKELCDLDDYGIQLNSPHFLLSEIISEIEHNDFANKDNRSLFKELLGRILKLDCAFSELYKVETGAEDIINKCRDYGLKTPEFHQEEDFRVVIWRASEEARNHDAAHDGTQLAPSWHPVGTQLLPNVENIDKLIQYCSEERSFAEILSFMNSTDRTKFRRKYIHPLLNEGLLEQTIPDKPNSRNQKYRLTAKGLALKETLKNGK